MNAGSVDWRGRVRLGRAGPRAHEDAAGRHRPPEGDWLGTPFLRFERHGSLATVTVDRPETRNALTPAMYFGIRYAVDHVNARRRPGRPAASPAPATCSSPAATWAASNGDGWADLPGLLGMDNTPFDAVRRSPKPVVCAVNGIAQGGGLMIAMLADVAVASDRATFRAPELLRGIADTNYGQILPRQIGPARGPRHAADRPEVSAAEAVDWGLVARVVPHDELLPAAVDGLQRCCRTAPEARLAVKRTIDEFYGHYDRMAMDASLAGPEMARASGPSRSAARRPGSPRTCGRRPL